MFLAQDQPFQVDVPDSKSLANIAHVPTQTPCSGIASSFPDQAQDISQNDPDTDRSNDHKKAACPQPHGRRGKVRLEENLWAQSKATFPETSIETLTMDGSKENLIASEAGAAIGAALRINTGPEAIVPWAPKSKLKIL